MPQSNNWKECFRLLPSNESGDKNLDAFLAALDTELDPNTLIANLVLETEAVFFAVDEEKQIFPLHSPKNFGGTRTRQTNKVAACMGLGSSVFGVEIDTRSALATNEFFTPSFDLLRDCGSAQELRDLGLPNQEQESATNDTSFCSLVSIVIPPPAIRDGLIRADPAVVLR